MTLPGARSVVDAAAAAVPIAVASNSPRALLEAALVRVVGVPTLRDSEFPADLVVDSLQDGGLLAWMRRWALTG